MINGRPLRVLQHVIWYIASDLFLDWGFTRPLLQKAADTYILKLGSVPIAACVALHRNSTKICHAEFGNSLLNLRALEEI